MMSVKVSALLPVGTIVGFKDSKKKFMVMGIMQKVPEGDTIKKYDYIGVPYPEGYVGKDSVILFQQGSIQDLVYYGYVDIERQSFMANVATKLGETWGD
jgi:hypothetical protein